MIDSGQGAGRRHRHHPQLQRGEDPEGDLPGPGHEAPTASAWQETIEGRGAGQRPGPLHGLHRLRVDLEHRRQQPAPQRDLPRERRRRPAGRALHRRMKPLGSDDPRRPVEVDGGLRGEDRRQRARDRPQRQPQQRPDVPDASSSSGRPVDRAYAETRAKWERLYEMTQTKGDGEAHPVPVAERRVRRLRTAGTRATSTAASRRRRRCCEFEYARSALKNGLMLEQKLGVNPYKFGMIGSTDAHTGLAAMEEDNFFGKTAPQEPSPERLSDDVLRPTRRRASRSWTGRSAPPATPRSGRPRTRARRSSTPCSAARPTPRRARAWSCASSAAGTSRPSDAHDRMPARHRLREGRADGRRPGAGAGGQGARPSSWARSRTRSARTSTASRSSRAGSTRRASCTRRSTTSCGRGERKLDAEDRQAAARGQHGGRRERDLDEHDRRAGADRGVEGPGLRSRAARVLLRPRARDPDAALDGVRRGALRHQAAAGHAG